MARKYSALVFGSAMNKPGTSMPVVGGLVSHSRYLRLRAAALKRGCTVVRSHQRVNGGAIVSHSYMLNNLCQLCVSSAPAEYTVA